MSLEHKHNGHHDTHAPDSAPLRWDSSGVAAVPYRVFFDPDVYELEQHRLFRGPVWNYVALEAELPNPCDFKTGFVGDTPVVVTRGRDSELHAFVNRCAHRGAMVCRATRGNSATHVCIYHQWSYNLEGNLIGVPFRRGLEGKGGYPADFATSEHSLQKLKTATYAGMIFVSFADDAEPIADYLGTDMRSWLDRTLNRPLKVLGFSRQVINGNWKLYAENVRDPYHGSLLHLFNATFGIARISQDGGVTLDNAGRHNVIYARKREDSTERAAFAAEKVATYETRYTLADAGLLKSVKDHGIDTTTTIQSIFPGLVVQQISNSLATRQILPKSASSFELVSTFFAYADDDDATVAIRLKQANLAGPAGYISLEDGYAIELVQQGIVHESNRSSFIELGGVEQVTKDGLVSEASIRGFWGHYRHLMQPAA